MFTPVNFPLATDTTVFGINDTGKIGHQPLAESGAQINPHMRGRIAGSPYRASLRNGG